MSTIELPQAIIDALASAEQGLQRTVVMMCGIAGSGKSTTAKAIVKHYPTYLRISIDELLAENHGLYGIDYPAEKYGKYLDEADLQLESTLIQLLKNTQRNLVIDRSFWAKETREQYRTILEPYNVRLVLIYLQPPSKDFVRQRIQSRREAGRDANCALDIDEYTLDMCWNGFEAPQDEGEIVIRYE